MVFKRANFYVVFLSIGAILSSSLTCAADGNVVSKFYNNYPFTEFRKFDPQDGEQVQVSDADLVSAIENYEIAVKNHLAKKLEITRIENGLRFVLRWDEYTTNDHVIELKQKPESRACFENSDVLRCFLLTSFRKETSPNRSIEDRPFVDVQSDYFLVRRSDGSLQAVASCYDERCGGVDWQ